MKPRVALNALFLHYPHSGTGRYLQQLVECGDRWADLTLLGASAFPPKVAVPASAALRLVRTPLDRRSANLAKVWLEQVGFGRAARELRADLIHYPYFAAPLLPSRPTVVTVHDLVPLSRPEYRRTAAQVLYTTLVARGLRSATTVITDSEASARDLRLRLALPRAKIRVIPLGVDPRFRPLTGAEERAWAAGVRARHGLTSPYVLYVGGFDRRKNVASLLVAFARLRQEGRSSHRLVLIGAPRKGDPLFYDPGPDLPRLGLVDAVVSTGPLADDELRAFLGGADVFVFPSLDEGFGLPPLEAMACGAPVVCSNASSLPEVVGDAGLLVDPTDVDGMAQAIARILDDPGLRQSLVERGLRRAASFSWARTAEATARVYAEVAERRR